MVGPGAIAAAVAAEKEADQRRDQVREALERDLEAARYATDRAFRQYEPTRPIGWWPARRGKLPAGRYINRKPGPAHETTKVVINNFYLRPTERHQTIAHGILQRAALAMVQNLMSNDCRT